MSPELDDIAAMRADGDLLDYVRSLTGRPPQQRASEPEPPPVIPRSRPGAWPDGTSPPGPIRAEAPGAWEAALERHRAGVDGPPCECGGCTSRGGAR